MTANRREFIERLVGGAVLLGGLPLTARATLAEREAACRSSQGAPWDLSWMKRLTARHKAIFDVAEVDSGYGVWRASIWMDDYMEVLGAAATDVVTVLVLRHDGVALAMRQAFWDEYQIGKAKSAKHPVTQQATDRNPALLSSVRGELPETAGRLALDEFIGRGGVVLACNLAFQQCIALVSSTHKVSPEAARARAMDGLVPGVILQPSGVFAAVRAQEAGCVYVRAS